MMKSLSNTIPNISNFTVEQYLNRMFQTKGSDFLAPSENLYGRVAASLLETDEINKEIHDNHNENLNKIRKTIIQEFLDENIEEKQ